MKFKLIKLILPLIFLFKALAVQAAPYAEFAIGKLWVDTPSETARPMLVDLRLGYEIPKHQFELALMASTSEYDINQLTVDVPSVVAGFWHFIPRQRSSLKIHTLLGVSRVEIDANYADLASSNESYYGLSYGIGFEEHFRSLPRLKVSADLLQLYLGDDLHIYSASIGLHYAF